MQALNLESQRFVLVHYKRNFNIHRFVKSNDKGISNFDYVFFQCNLKFMLDYALIPKIFMEIKPIAYFLMDRPLL